MLQFDPTIDLGNVITALILIGGLWRWTVAQSRRDQKIDMVLFGDERGGIPGLVKDVHDLKLDRDDVFTHLGKLGVNRRPPHPMERH